jgi:putative protease
LGNNYSFKEFQDTRGEYFRLISGGEGSLVVPGRPFSITDKTGYLKEAGYRRFILDFTGCSFSGNSPDRRSAVPLTKKDYKNIMQAVEKCLPLPGSTRFNWKDGFYTIKE